MDFPRPTRDDPVYGDAIEGPPYERPTGGFPFGITRTCDHPEIALDFLLFMASRSRNEQFNRIIGWIPSVIETEMPELLTAFAPHLRGVYGCLNLFLGGETWVRWLQLYSLYQVQQISYEDMAARFQPFYIEQGRKDFAEIDRDWRRAMLRDEIFLAGVRARGLMSSGPQATTQWIKYRSLSMDRQISREVEQNRKAKLVSGELLLPACDPYEYSETILRRIRQPEASE
jgi:raffinose/stachyose/melibiose transport system substrate-binding protein